MASAGCNFTRVAGPFLDEIPGKKVFYGVMSFQSAAGYDTAARPRVHGGDVGSRPQDVFFGTIFIEHLILFQNGSELDCAQASQAGHGTGCAKAEFLIDSQTVKLWTTGNFFNVTVLASNETEMITDTSAPFPLTSMTFECKVICGA